MTTQSSVSLNRERHMIKRFDDLIELLGEYLSSEFNRKGKSSKKLNRWKATEFRTFFLYTGLIILKEVLSEDEYNNFLYFFVSMRLLLSPSPTKRQIKFANLCLRKYVYEFSILYGDHHLVYNFHNLIHLTDDCDFYEASLNDISAFPFESYIGEMKRDIKGTIKPLAQYYRRYSERLHIEKSHPYQPTETRIVDSLRENSKADSFIMLPNDSIFKIFAMKTGSEVIVVQKLNITYDDDGSRKEFFLRPMPATDLNIFVCDGLCNSRTFLPTSVLLTAKKCIAFPFENSENEDSKWLVIPLLHTM